jgi:hypothetical protein
MHGRYLLWFGAFIFLICVGVPMGVTYAVDPLQFFHRAWYAPTWSANERYQEPGLVRNFAYDTVIIGSSMTQNFYPSYVDRVLGGRTMKLSIAGSTAHEQYLILSLALATGKPKRVIWGIDDWVFRGPADRVRSDLGPFPFYLYDGDPFEYVEYLFNWSTFSDSLAILRDRTRLAAPGADRPPDEWDTFDKLYRFARDRAIADYFNPRTISAFDAAIRSNAYDVEQMRVSFAANMLSLIEQNPKVEFDLFFPPYSILNAKFYEVRYPALFDELLSFKGDLASRLVREPNVRLFDFQDITAITEDLDHYKDTGHFDVAINQYIIDSIAHNAHRVDAADPTASIRRLREQVVAYPAPHRDESGSVAAGR